MEVDAYIARGMTSGVREPAFATRGADRLPALHADIRREVHESPAAQVRATSAIGQTEQAGDQTRPGHSRPVGARRVSVGAMHALTRLLHRRPSPPGEGAS